MIKALAIDIDGTLTFQNRQLDLEAIKAIRRAEKENLPVILATGNILCFAEAASVMLGTSGPVIAEDGGIILDIDDDEVYVIGDLSEIERGMNLLEEEFSNIVHTRTSEDRIAGRTLERTFDAEKATRIFREEDLNLVAIDSGFAIHIKNPEVNKGKALHKAASLINIKEPEIAAIGDGKNDVELIERAGIGIAIENSHEELKETADHVFNQSYGSGVSAAINQILKENIE
ncbi:MAG: phosphoglycolate phosphatase [Hadesarchaea archaeon]|nr:phosphoglycolate phosphatase [Hadesarchaea archaeon]